MDEVVWILIVAGLALAVPVLGVVGFVRGGRAEREIALLKNRLATLEAQIEARGQRVSSDPVVASDTPAVEEPVPVAAATPAAPRQSLEEKIAGRWAVWLGGGTIALAAIFLVRYSIEEGLLGPTARILLGLAFGLALIVAAEWLRRRVDDELGPGVFGRLAVPPPMIPPALASAGVVSLFATAFAAFAVHDFISPMTAFVALAAISAGAMALALLHGPMVALRARRPPSRCRRW